MNPEEDTVPTDPGDSDSSSDSSRDSSSDSASDTHSDTNSVTGSDSTIDTQSDSNSDTGSDSGSESDSDTEKDTAVPGCSPAAVNGSCAETHVVYCEDNAVKKLDCDIVGETCGVIDGRADCETVERHTACGELTPLGDCVENTIRWCDETNIMAVPVQYDCGLYGRQCDATAGADGGADCLSHGVCGDIDENGICTENTLSYCYGDGLFVFDCGTDQCQVVAGLADCFAAGVGQGCGDETVEGRCNGNELVRCSGGTVTTEDCAVLGMQCVENSTASCQRDVACSEECAQGYTCQDGLCAGPADAPLEWTIAVYMVGDNNLSNAVWQDLNEMESVDLGESIAVVTEFELSQEYTSFAPEQYRTGAYRMAISHDTDPSVVSSLSEAEALGETDMTDPAHVAAFARWAAQTYPSKRFAFIFWDHGLGWRGGFIDSRSSGVMTLRDIVEGVRDSGTNPDLIGFDACMMGMHEVALALRGISNTLVASEEAVPGGGYPYDEVLQSLIAAPTSDAQTLGQMISGVYTQQYTTGLRARSVTMSVLNLEQSMVVGDALAEFSQAFIADLPGRRLDVRQGIRSETLLRYREKDSADLISTMDIFEGLGGDMGAAAANFKAGFAGTGYVVDSQATLKVSASSGVAIHLPANAFSLYNNNSFEMYRESTGFLPLEPWHDVLANLTESNSAIPVAGIDGFKIALEWADSPEGNQSAIDLDLVVVEPSGEESAAANGSVTSNGLLSADSVDSQIPIEWYQLRDGHQPGIYVVLVHMYVDENTPVTAEQAYPTVTISVGDDVTVRQRGYVENREVVYVPMDNSAPFPSEGKITSDNVSQVLNREFSTLWYVTTLQVQ